MKKKEDLRKHFSEENIDSLIEKTKYFFLLLCLFTNINYAQVSLNNFGITEVIPTHSRYTKFTQIDYNRDNLVDLFLYGNKEKSFVLHKGLTDSSFSDPIRKFFFYPIDDFKWLTKTKQKVDYYIFASRNKRLVGLVSFTKSNSLQLLNTIEFNSYPSSIKIVDLDNNGKNEVLVFGNNFNGITLIYNDGYFLNSEVVYSENLFSDLEIIDFNNDGLLDIVAVDLLNNSLKFFENTEDKNFVLNREEKREENINCLNKFDFNNDSFIDLAIGTDAGIEVLEGDSVFSFSNSWIMNDIRRVDNFLISPIVNDSTADIAVLNTTNDNIEFFFGDFNSPTSLVFNVNGISDFQKQKYGNQRAFLALSKNRIINRLTNTTKWGQDFNFSVSGFPDRLIGVRINNGQNKSIIYGDDKSNSIKFLEIDNQGKFESQSEYGFLNEFLTFGHSEDLSILYGFETDSRLLEIINVDNAKNNQNYFYAKYPILEIKPGYENSLIILEQFESELYIENVIKTKNGFESVSITKVDSSFTSHLLSRNGDVFYWQRIDSTYYLNKFNNETTKNILYFNDPDSIISNVVFVNSELTGNDIFTIISKENEQLVYKIGNNEYTLFELDSGIKFDENFTTIKYYTNISNGDLLTAYRSNKKEFYIFDLDRKKKTMKVNTVIKDVDINDYFMADFFNKTYLVYINDENNLIKFKYLTL